MRWLVTGAAGFVGGHVVAHLREEGARELFGLVRRPPREAGYAALEAELLDAVAVGRAVAAARPDRIVHLAAQSSAADSWDDPAGTLRTNVVGLQNLLDAVRQSGLRPHILVVGSAEEYGASGEPARALLEDAALRPASPYAVSKVAQGYLALQHFIAHGLWIVRTRTFNHSGPGRGAAFAESQFARQIAEIELGRRPPSLLVGNLDAVRDFSDVRDVARAYLLLLERGTPGDVYNVASGRGRSLREVLDLLLGLARRPIEVRIDPALLRPADVPHLVGDATRLAQATGWAPRIPFDQTLRELLDYWRDAVYAAERVTT